MAAVQLVFIVFVSSSFYFICHAASRISQISEQSGIPDYWIKATTAAASAALATGLAYAASS
jgi:hypothetical protein